ncbi:MAG: NAD(P)-binding domain-containing protein [Pyrinomonadaceae bacterium]|nr:NAD(P)-binding domain-containing protein [Pyrinomonadaceae bacterium]
MIDRSAHMAVIGAGPVGLAVAKALLENGIPYEQLEGDDDLGGNWYHGVYETAHIISSRKTTEYADFPMPADFPDFPSAQQMLEYLNSYAETFRLREHIQFKTKVVMCLPSRQMGAPLDARENGQPASPSSWGSDKTLDVGRWTLDSQRRWEVELADGEKRIYKGVIVCSGHHWDKRFPTYPGEFTGDYIHSKDYKNPQQLIGKRVLVIGGGNSACDVASEAARVGRSSDLSLRRGYWFLPKVLFGVPIPELVPSWVPVWVQRVFLKLALRIAVGKYEDYGLPKPTHRIFEAHPTLNSEILHYVKHGRIRPRPDVAKFEGRRVVFKDGSSDEFDMVVCGTGFNLSFPFLPNGLVPVEGKNALLYAGCTLPDYKNLYIVGTPQVRYGFGPLITPAAALLCRLISLQDQMELPIGLVLKESGAKLPTTHLVDPHKALRQMRYAKYTLPLLLRKERKLRRRLASRQESDGSRQMSGNTAGDLQRVSHELKIF